MNNISIYFLKIAIWNEKLFGRAVVAFQGFFKNDMRKHFSCVTIATIAS